MVGADKVDNRLLGKRRKAIETVFSNLESLGIQAFNSRSYQAFKFRIESLLLVYDLMLKKAEATIWQHFTLLVGEVLIN